MVKKFINTVIAAIVLFAVSNASAQEVTKREVFQLSVSVGKGSTSEIGSVLGGAFSCNIDGENTKFTPCFNFQGMVNINNHVGMGLTLCSQKSVTYTDNFDNGKYNNFHFSVLPTFRVYWLNTNVLSVYSKVAAGMSFDYEFIYNSVNHPTAEFNKSNHFSYQMSPIGVELGAKHFRAFAEAGYGVEGLLQAGVRARF